MALPQWAQKPYQRNKTVVATPRGWMVKETGEYIKLVSGLDRRLVELAQESKEAAQAILSDEKEQDGPAQGVDEEKPVDEPTEPSEPVSEDEPTPTEESTPSKKKPGRPKKNKTEE